MWIILVIGIIIAYIYYMYIKDLRIMDTLNGKIYEEKWNKILKKSTIVKKIANEINLKYIIKTEIYLDHIVLEEKNIYYSEINLENLPSYKECLLLAQNIKEKLKFKNIYSIEPIKKYYYVPHASKLTGFTETIDGNFSANYTDNSGSERIIGYKLLTHATENNSYYNEKKAIESWKKKES